MKDNQYEQLFTELTPVEAAVVEGGKDFRGTLNFDEDQKTGRFKVSPNATIKLFTNTYNSGGRSSDNPDFYAAIRNVDTNNKNEKLVSVGEDTTTWTNVRGGTYVIDFRDRADRIYVAGEIKVTYS
ncbi:hypothetical protein WA1_23575 [Scytonema hofmannii PCC 7110]|uniref:Uncharacterized protein n=1 Tax=Scytonema hofmannii PCC 7110 TaxID=128403 RepID=A0A139X8S5_9CYAN|nr:hypothetical protein [Scytonema hofmannii]KYC41098.1 hypothetical protein WA1_23575 [Scytonema hofmannii PCC 7110]